MAERAFMDESRRNGDYLVCAVVVPERECGSISKELRQLRLGGQSRIHMKNESSSRRRLLLSAIESMNARAWIYGSETRRASERERREACLTALVDDLVANDVRRLTIESCDQDAQDRRVIALHCKGRRLEYEHSKPAAQPLLWLPDIVGWAHGRGGDWTRRSAEVVSFQKRIDL